MAAKISRQKALQEAGTSTGQVAAPSHRSVSDILLLLKKNGAMETMKTLTETEEKMLIDFAAELDDRRAKLVKQCKEEVEPIKDLFKAIAQQDNEMVHYGNTAELTVKASSKSIMGPTTELAKLLKQEGKTRLFNELTTIKVTEAKKFLGEDALISSGLMRVETDDFGAVTLKVLRASK
jgi:hypothetical protein